MQVRGSDFPRRAHATVGKWAKRRVSPLIAAKTRPLLKQDLRTLSLTLYYCAGALVWQLCPDALFTTVRHLPASGKRPCCRKGTEAAVIRPAPPFRILRLFLGSSWEFRRCFLWHARFGAIASPWGLKTSNLAFIACCACANAVHIGEHRDRSRVSSSARRVPSGRSAQWWSEMCRCLPSHEDGDDGGPYCL